MVPQAMSSPWLMSRPCGSCSAVPAHGWKRDGIALLDMLTMISLNCGRLRSSPTIPIQDKWAGAWQRPVSHLRCMPRKSLIKFPRLCQLQHIVIVRRFSGLGVNPVDIADQVQVFRQVRRGYRSACPVQSHGCLAAMGSCSRSWPLISLAPSVSADPQSFDGGCLPAPGSQKAEDFAGPDLDPGCARIGLHLYCL